MNRRPILGRRTAIRCNNTDGHLHSFKEGLLNPFTLKNNVICFKNSTNFLIQPIFEKNAHAQRLTESF